MVRAAAILALLAALALPLAAEGNPLEGHEVTAELPAGALVVGGAVAGWTWAGPLVLLIDGRPAARIELPAAAAPLPRPRLWPYLAAAAAGALAGLLIAR